MKNVISCFLIIFLLLFPLGCANKADTPKMAYAVLIGEDSSIIDSISNVNVLVIDAEYFTTEEITSLRNNGINYIYSYLNVGSIENFRSYYEDYIDITLAEYDNWPEERWVNVSRPEWQSFIANRVDELSQKGIDGFFIDNTDVYYLYPSEDIYNGLIHILQYIHDSGRKSIINGGDCFVKAYFDSSSSEDCLFNGVNQENVYTHYDFTNEQYQVNDKKEMEYFTEYLDIVLANGCEAYTLEYATNQAIANKALEYSNEHRYICYISDNIELKYNK